MCYKTRRLQWRPAAGSFRHSPDLGVVLLSLGLSSVQGRPQRSGVLSLAFEVHSLFRPSAFRVPFRSVVAAFLSTARSGIAGLVLGFDFSRSIGVIASMGFSIVCNLFFFFYFFFILFFYCLLALHVVAA